MKKTLLGFILLIVAASPAFADGPSGHVHDGVAVPPVEEMVGGQIVRRCPRCGQVIEVEGEKDFSFGADAAFLSKYVSRGLNTTDDWVFQPYAWVSCKGLTFGAWGNLDLTGVNGYRGEFNEIDLILDYSWDWDIVQLSAGYIHYEYPNTGAHFTDEVYGGVGLDVPLNPKLAVFYDFTEVDGFYATLSVGHSFDLTEYVKVFEAGLDLSAQAGWGSKNFNNFNFGSDHDAFTDIVLSASLPVQIMNGLSMTPTVIYSTALDRTIRGKIEKDDNIIWGATLSYTY